MSTVKYVLIRDVHPPVRGTSESAGIDFYIPYFDEIFLRDLIAKNSQEGLKIEYRICEDPDGSEILEMTVPAHSRILIPSGVKTYFDAGGALIAANKSGVATKKGLVFAAQVVDSDYTGEIHLGIINTTDRPVTVRTGEKIMQFIHMPVYLSDFEEIDDAEFAYLHQTSERQDGGFGSTGN